MKKILIPAALVVLVVLGIAAYFTVSKLAINKHIGAAMERIGAKSWEYKSASFKAGTGELMITGLQANFEGGSYFKVDEITALVDRDAETAEIAQFTDFKYTHKRNTFSINSGEVTNLDYSRLSGIQQMSQSDAYFRGWLAPSVGLDMLTVKGIGLKSPSIELNMESISITGPVTAETMPPQVKMKASNITAITGASAVVIPEVTQHRLYNKTTSQYSESTNAAITEIGDFEISYTFSNFDPEKIVADPENMKKLLFDELYISVDDHGMANRILTFISLFSGSSNRQDNIAAVEAWMRMNLFESVENTDELLDIISSYLINPENLRIYKNSATPVAFESLSDYQPRLLNQMQLTISANGRETVVKFAER